jgi:creatinine amidohydrolase
MRWGDLTSSELDRMSRTTPVVLNVAAIEQHGSHLPLKTDAVIGQHFLDRLEHELGRDVLILPPMQVGCSQHHMEFAGSLTVTHDSFLSYAENILSSVAGWGFTNIVILNSHGGNQAVGQVLVEQAGPRLHGVNLVVATWWRLATSELELIGETGPLGVGHACEFETSLMMHIDASAVRYPIPEGEHYIKRFEWSDGGMLRGPRASLYRSIGEISGGTGVVGTPSAGSAEKGARISEVIERALAELLRSMKQAGRLVDEGPARTERKMTGAARS